MELFAAALLLGGCIKSPYHVERCERPDLSGCVVDSVAILNNEAVSDSDVEEKIATVETSHVLGGLVEHVPILSLWDRLTVDYERLDPVVLQRDLARIERYYRARGYYEAHVRAGRTIKQPGGKVRVEIVVDEGAPVRVGKVDLAWKDWNIERAARVTIPVNNAANSLEPGTIFDEESLEATKKKILRAMTNHGFAYASVEGKADVDLTTHKARVVYTIELGPHTTFGDISIEGAGELPVAPLLASLQIKKGDEFSTAALDTAEIALGDFGVFGAIDVAPKLSPKGQPPNPVVPVVFRVQPSALRAIKLGLGAELGGRVEAHGLLGWENRNLFGGLRRFSTEARPGLVLFPKRIDTLFDDETVTILPEFRFRFELRQPAMLMPFEPKTTGILRGAFNIYRLPTISLNPDDKYVVGYREIAGSAGLERPFWNSQVFLSLLMNVQYDNPFTYREAPLPAGYENLLIPYGQLTAVLDLRRGADGKRNRVDPHSGIYLSNDLQLAFADTQDIRFQPEFRAYVPVSRHVTLAFRLAGGILVPYGQSGDEKYYERFDQGICQRLNSEGEEPDSPGQTSPAWPQCNRALQIVQFRAFFSGGANSNRGYPYNGVGPHETLRFLSDVPIATGGTHLWESSVELRFPLVGKLGSALFLDASDVSRSQFRLCAPHLSTGFGLRYATPVGPLRADVGYRIPGAQVFMTDSTGACPNPEQEEGLAGSVLGLPIAVSVAIGEAF